MGLSDTLILLGAKCISLVIRALRLGAGATWPGEIALRISPNILSRLIEGRTVVVVCGTNGKTTTAKMLEAILAHSGVRTRRNQSGANLDNGLVSGFVDDMRWNGSFRSTTFVFEVDEATLPRLLPTIIPRIIVLLNLFRDQLDRYGEVDAIAEKWLEGLRKLPKSTDIIINADDPQLSYIGSLLKARVSYFGLDDPSLFIRKMQHATDSIYCPKCGHRLTFGGMYFSHLGKWTCGHCGLLHPEMELTAKDVSSPLEGTYNTYNTMAAALTAHVLGLKKRDIENGLASFTPAFGRMETLHEDGKSVRILLSKNPTGFNESLRAVTASNLSGPLLLALNDRTADGRDVSWIWDVDFELLKGYSYPIVICGDRCYDLAVRLVYAGVPGTRMSVHEVLADAINQAREKTDRGQMLWILATYTAMLDVRGFITGRKIL